MSALFPRYQPTGCRLENGLVQLGFGDELLRAGVLPLELLQTLRLIGAHATVLLAPTVVGLLGDADLASDVHPRRAMRQLHFCLAQLSDDLFGLVLLPGHRASPCVGRILSRNPGSVVGGPVSDKHLARSQPPRDEPDESNSVP